MLTAFCVALFVLIWCFFVVKCVFVRNEEANELKNGLCSSLGVVALLVILPTGIGSIVALLERWLS